MVSHLARHTYVLPSCSKMQSQPKTGGPRAGTIFPCSSQKETVVSDKLFPRKVFFGGGGGLGHDRSRIKSHGHPCLGDHPPPKRLLTSVMPWNSTGSWPGPWEKPKVQTALAPLSSYAASRLFRPSWPMSLRNHLLCTLQRKRIKCR